MMEVLKLVIPVVIAVLGWILGHLLSSIRERENKKREIRLEKLMEAYDWFGRAMIEGQNEEINVQLSMAIHNSQCYGTCREQKMAIEYCQAIKEKKSADALELIKSIRNVIREELGLSPFEEPVSWVVHSADTDK
ncbi:hypothetical protein [Sedimentisphaera salicampi]|uniref:DUF2489 domain-containing protein n=1 Tax=Sedimentisphaera salicampi TaxID=1941349 RepID=A0A1W6LNV5_9BACT|nr:hypothetical protein [Sedimentisphaera salicampi]ARN57416.1 hypothetical protein STSP1_01823 [Sedimentisphaera salicampi]